MFNLVRKDFIVLKKVLLMASAYGLFFTVAFQSLGNSTTIYTAVSTVVAYMLLTSACAYDDKYRTDTMLNSLPIKRKDIVKSKYISMVLYMIIGWTITFVAIYLLKASGLGKLDNHVGLDGILSCILSVITIGSCYLPIYFKFGYVKSKYVSIIFMVAAFIVPMGIGAGISENGTPQFIISIMNQSEWVVSGLMMLIIFVILFTSIAFSEKIYLNKDI